MRSFLLTVEEVANSLMYIITDSFDALIIIQIFVAMINVFLINIFKQVL